MKSAKKIFIPAFILILGLVWAQTSHSFRLEDLLKPPDPPQEKQTQQPSSSEPQPAPKQEQGGLIGFGESLGLFDKKTSKILKGSVTTLQSFQPIGIEEEKAIGGALAVEVFSRYGGMLKNPDLQKYVSLVGQAVAEVSDRADIEYHFAVLDTENSNAFATPGGYVFVSLGLLRMLGHEIAHITQKHALNTLQRSKLLQGLSSVTMAALDKDSGLFDKIINQVSETLFTKGLDKELEFEADQYGTEFAYRTGYFPGGLRDFIKTLGKSESKDRSIFLSTHPGPRERYSKLSSHMQKYKSALLSPVLSNRYKTQVKSRL
jgi:predicted Zn-dependent protease